MSLFRKMKRDWARKAGDTQETKPQVIQWQPDGGYRVLHPTKGWRRVSPKRLRHFPMPA